MNGQQRSVFGLAYSADEWPHGLRCQRCEQVREQMMAVLNALKPGFIPQPPTSDEDT
jgi:hypothetical protein